MAAALAERRFLAEVEHPNIVKIHNFVEHARRRLHRHGVRRRRQPAAACSRHGGAPTAAGPTRCRSSRRSPTASRSCRRSATSTTSGWCSATSSRTTSSRRRGSLKLIDLGGVYRMDDQASPVYGTVGYQAPEIAQTGTDRRLRPVHRRPHARRAVHRLRRLPEHLPLHAAAGARRVRCTHASTRCTASSSGRRLPIPTSASRAPRRWAPSCSACCARSSPPTAARRRLGAEHALHPAGAGFARRAPTGARCRRRWSIPTIPPAGVIIVSAAGPRRGHPPARRPAGQQRRDRPLARPGADRARPRRRGRAPCSTASRPPTRGSGGRRGTAGSPRSPPATPRRRGGLRRVSTGRFPASWRRSWRWR